MASTTIRFESFKGINRLKAKTLLELNELHEAKGVINDERGRLKACWEGQPDLRDVLNSSDTLYNYFKRWAPYSAPQTALIFDAEPILANRHLAANIRTDDIYTSGEDYSVAQQEWIPVEVLPGEYAFLDYPNNTLFMTYHFGDVLVEKDNPTKRYFIINSSTTTSTFPATIPEFKVDVSNPQVVYKERWSTNIQMMEFNGFLIVCKEGFPALAIPKDSIHTNYKQSNGYEQWIESIGIQFFTSWVEETALYRDNAAPFVLDYSGSIDFFNDFDITGYTGTLPTQYQSAFRPFIWLYADQQQADVDKIDVYSDTEIVSADSVRADSFETTPKSYNSTTRIGKIAHRLSLRHPVSYKGRFCAFEGRYVSDPLNGGFNGGTSATGTYLDPNIYPQFPNGALRFNGNLTQEAGNAEFVVVYENATGTIPDYQTTTVGNQILKCKVYYSINDTATYVEFDDRQNYELSSTTQLNVHFLRRLTTDERRTLYFFGRPADTANGVSRDDTDFLYFDPLNSVIIGDDEDGDITAAIADADNRIIVGLDSAIYQVTGDPPVAGIPGRGFNVQKLAGGIGFYSDKSLTWDETGQILYFCNSVDKGIYALYGNAVDRNRLDAAIINHPRHPYNNDRGFSHLAVSNGRLYAQTDDEFPVIWIYDFRTEGWTYTERKSVVIESPSVDVSAFTYKTVYHTDEQRYGYNSGGLFTPFRSGYSRPAGTDSSDDLYVFGEYFPPGKWINDPTLYQDGICIKTLNKPSEYTTDAMHRHSGIIETAYVDGDIEAAKKVRQVRVLSTENDLYVVAQSTIQEAYKAITVEATNSEGDTLLSRTVKPDWESADADKYRVQGAGGRGDTSIAITINGSTEAVIPEIDSIEVDVVALPHRKR